MDTAMLIGGHSKAGTELQEVVLNPRTGLEILALAEASNAQVDAAVDAADKAFDSWSLWAYMRGVVLDFSRPGKPTNNAYTEAFSGSFRAECLDAHWLMSLKDARQKDVGFVQVLQ